MKPVQTKFGQALQLAETRQQIGGLEQQVEKLKSDIKELRDLDRQIFDDQDREIMSLKALVQEYAQLVAQRIGTLNPVPPNGWSDKAIELERRAQELLREES